MVQLSTACATRHRQRTNRRRAHGHRETMSSISSLGEDEGGAGNGRGRGRGRGKGRGRGTEGDGVWYTPGPHHQHHSNHSNASGLQPVQPVQPVPQSQQQWQWQWQQQHHHHQWQPFPHTAPHYHLTPHPRMAAAPPHYSGPRVAVADPLGLLGSPVPDVGAGLPPMTAQQIQHHQRMQQQQHSQWQQWQQFGGSPPQGATPVPDLVPHPLPGGDLVENLHRLHVGLPQAARGGGVPGATQMPRAHSTRAPAHQLELVDANLPPLDLVGVDVLICLDFEATCDEGSAQLTVLLPVAGCRWPVACVCSV